MTISAILISNQSSSFDKEKNPHIYIGKKCPLLSTDPKPFNNFGRGSPNGHKMLYIIFKSAELYLTKTLKFSL